MNEEAIYTRAKEAKEKVVNLCKRKVFSNIEVGIGHLFEVVKSLPYDERCVIAAGRFTIWNGTWQFMISNTKSVMNQMKFRDDSGDPDFAAVHVYTRENGDDDETGHFVRTTRLISMYNNKSNKKEEKDDDPS